MPAHRVSVWHSRHARRVYRRGDWRRCGRTGRLEGSASRMALPRNRRMAIYTRTSSRKGWEKQPISSHLSSQNDRSTFRGMPTSTFTTRQRHNASNTGRYFLQPRKVSQHGTRKRHKAITYWNTFSGHFGRYMSR